MGNIFRDPMVLHIFLHDRKESLLYSKYKWSGFRIEQGKHYQGGFSKSAISSVNHKNGPCNAEMMGTENACHELRAMETFQDKYDCILPWDNREGVLCDFDQLSEALLNYTCTADSGQLFCDANEYVDCTNIPRPCEKLDITAGADDHDIYVNQSYASIEFGINNELVSYVEDYIGYDWQSFIGEVGGTFGVFLGFSCLTLIIDLKNFALSLTQKMKKSKKIHSPIV